MNLPGETRIAELLRPYIAADLLTPQVLKSLRAYLELVLRWNSHINLTAVREPELLVQRQIGESLYAAQCLPATGSMLDFGSGAGFPGIPLQILRSDLAVTLAESQGRKAAFLREATRALSLPCEVWSGRVEQMPAERTFDVVTMRAVDGTEEMLPIAEARVRPAGWLVRFTGAKGCTGSSKWIALKDLAVPQSDGRLVLLTRS